MDPLSACWPPYALCVTAGDLTLRAVRESDLAELVELVAGGIHDPGSLPFDQPWTAVTDPVQRAVQYVRYQSSIKASFTPDAFNLELAVRVGEQIVGIQGLTTREFGVSRTGETGSWLGMSHQGRGIGTRMRQAVCAFAFDTLGAHQVTSSAFVDNPASLAVSRKVGYRLNGVRTKVRAGVAASNQQLLLTPDAFVRGDPVTVDGAEPLLGFLGL